MSKRKNVDVVATTMSRFSHVARPSDEDAAPRLPDTASSDVSVAARP